MKLLLLCGTPGSGKSTIAKELYPNYVRLNQDELGDRQTCINECIKAFTQGKDVIIDRCNINRSQRDHWISLGLNYGVESITCLVLQEDPEECIARIHLRKGHPTIKDDISIDKRREIVYNFYNNFEMPSLKEGINKIIVSKSAFLLREK